MTNTAAHPFERAGLGKAPYRLVGSHVSKWQACPGAPIQCGASCDYCGQGIMNVYVIQSSDGRRFKVGCDCVGKTGDKKLAKAVDAVRREQERGKRAVAAKQSKSELSELLASDAVRAKLAALPHPSRWASEQGKTLLDWAEFMAERAGATGRKKALKAMASVA